MNSNHFILKTSWWYFENNTALILINKISFWVQLSSINAADSFYLQLELCTDQYLLNITISPHHISVGPDDFDIKNPIKWDLRQSYNPWLESVTYSVCEIPWCGAHWIGPVHSALASYPICRQNRSYLYNEASDKTSALHFFAFIRLMAVIGYGRHANIRMRCSTSLSWQRESFTNHRVPHETWQRLMRCCVLCFGVAWIKTAI